MATVRDRFGVRNTNQTRAIFSSNDPTTEEIVRAGKRVLEELRKVEGNQAMHYRNGREAKNGDKIVSLGGYGSGPVAINAVGILFDAKPGNDYCNGSIASTIGGPVTAACLCDCLHVDDLAELLKNAGLDKRPPGK